MKKENIKEIVLYFVVGICTTIVDFSTYLLFSRVLHIHPSIANAMSWTIAVTFAYLGDKIFVFKTQKFSLSIVLKEFGSFVSMRLISGLIDVSGFHLFSTVLGFKDIYVKFGLMIIVVILNYTFSKFFIFKNDN